MVFLYIGASLYKLLLLTRIMFMLVYELAHIAILMLRVFVYW